MKRIAQAMIQLIATYRNDPIAIITAAFIGVLSLGEVILTPPPVQYDIV